MEEKDSMKGEIISINISKEKGEVKKPVAQAEFLEDFGIRGDVHAGDSTRQVSLLGEEIIKEFEQENGVELEPGAFAENITIQGLDLANLKIGAELIVGQNIKLRISQIGKECHQGCAIRELTGDCIMPTRGLFAQVIHGGKAKKGDRIEVLNGTS